MKNWMRKALHKVADVLEEFDYVRELLWALVGLVALIIFIWRLAT